MNINITIAIIIFFFSLYCIVFHNKNLIVTLIFIEIGFLSVSLILIFLSYSYGDIKSQIIIIYVLTLTAIETAFGLALFILFYKKFNSIEAEDFYKLKY